MSLVSVWTDVGGRKPIPLIAKIVEKDGVIFTIRYLSESDDKIWRYEEETYDIDDDSIAEYFKTDREEHIGFTPCGPDGFIKGDSDEDYEPSDEDVQSEDESDEECETEEDDAVLTEEDEEEEEDKCEIE